MRNLLAFAAAAVLVFLGLGWYFDWYKVKAVPTNDGHQSFSIDIDKSKIGKDVQTFEKSIEKKKQQYESEAAPKNDKAKGVSLFAGPPTEATPVKTANPQP